MVPWKKRRIMFKKDDYNRLQIESKFNNTNSTFIKDL